MAATLGFGVTAEGIETPDQLRWASSLGCTLAQGYALGRPTTFDAFPLETLWT
jgi:EAL domain-containing protein (putative c-di-GMP-specific phosphodiesterase class I)